jgi:hypothetical protein
MRRAFVSHSTADDAFVAEMESFVRNAAGFDEVFNDVSAIRPDEKFWPKIEEGITNCDSFVVVITAASEWAKREVEFARGLSKKVIPIWPRTSVDSTAQKMGQLELKLAIAPNHITGLWQIRVREFASGLRDDPYLEYQKLVRIDSACSTVESRDTLGTRL